MNGLCCFSWPIVLVGPWPGNTSGLVGQDEKLVAEAAQEDATIAPRQVEAPDAHLEEHVAGEDDALAVEAEVARGMARAVEHLEAQVADRQLVALVDELLGLGYGWWRLPHHVRGEAGLTAGGGEGFLVHGQGRLGSVSEGLHRPDVVDVGVRAGDELDSELLTLQGGQDVI